MNEKTPEKEESEKPPVSSPEKSKDVLSSTLKETSNNSDNKSPANLTPERKTSEAITPEKSEFQNDETPKKNNYQINFKTPTKSLSKQKLEGNNICNGTKINGNYYTPEKKNEFSDIQSEQKVEDDLCTQNDGEEGMISTTEQARLLIAASKTPLKGMDKTPNKQSTPSRKRSIENSPVTPGKFRRVELITLSSPKTKRIKEI